MEFLPAGHRADFEKRRGGAGRSVQSYGPSVENRMVAPAELLYNVILLDQPNGGDYHRYCAA